jgi:hypothetical protein
MRRIIYTSRRLNKGDLAELDAIVAESIARNAKAGITGMLWSDSVISLRLSKAVMTKSVPRWTVFGPIRGTRISTWFLIAL